MCLANVKKTKDVLFIDASKYFEPGKNQNYLRDEDIERIMDVYRNRRKVDKFSHIATIEEVTENDFNLNIPRYVDTFEPEPEIDIFEVQREIKQIEKKSKKLTS